MGSTPTSAPNRPGGTQTRDDLLIRQALCVGAASRPRTRSAVLAGHASARARPGGRSYRRAEESNPRHIGPIRFRGGGHSTVTTPSVGAVWDRDFQSPCHLGRASAQYIAVPQIAANPTIKPADHRGPAGSAKSLVDAKLNPRRAVSPNDPPDRYWRNWMSTSNVSLRNQYSTSFHDVKCAQLSHL